MQRGSQVKEIARISSVRFDCLLEQFDGVLVHLVVGRGAPDQVVADERPGLVYARPEGIEVGIGRRAPRLRTGEHAELPDNLHSLWSQRLTHLVDDLTSDVAATSRDRAGT